MRFPGSSDYCSGRLSVLCVYNVLYAQIMGGIKQRRSAGRSVSGRLSWRNAVSAEGSNVTLPKGTFLRLIHREKPLTYC